MQFPPPFSSSTLTLILSNSSNSSPYQSLQLQPIASSRSLVASSRSLVATSRSLVASSRRSFATPHRLSEISIEMLNNEREMVGDITEYTPHEDDK